MQPTDKTAFAALIVKTWRFYDKTPIAETVADWFDLLEGFALDAVATAFRRHLADPKAGQYLPKPADILRHLPGAVCRDGRPEADEAWGLLLRLVNDESETGVFSDEMRAAWATCQPILNAGDTIGARRCFIETYQRSVQEARQNGSKAHWTATLGTDPQRRIQRLQEAVAARRISADHAHSLLPGPSPASLDHVAGLLSGPDAPVSDRQASQRLRELATMIRNGMHQAEDKRQSDRQRRIEAERQQKQAIARLIEQRQGKPQQGANP
jgi:hypothetical protein